MGALGALLLTFLGVGAPIGIALCAATVAFILYDPFLSENAIFRSFFSFVNKYTLMAIPFFIYAGFLMERTGLIKKLFRFADALIGWLPGGFAYATILAAVMFGAISGSSTAQIYLRDIATITRGSREPASNFLRFDGEQVHYLAGRQTTWHVVE